jgi:hypothetical protein
MVKHLSKFRESTLLVGLDKEIELEHNGKKNPQKLHTEFLTSIAFGVLALNSRNWR